MEVGDNMELIFADATKIQIQSAQETGGKLEIKVIQVAPAQLRELFTDPVKTKIMRIVEREQNIAEYEDYTEFYRTEEYAAGIYGVVVNKVGKSAEERLAELEMENTALKEALEDANTQITDLQGAICELYEMGVQK
jgi:hypothetical protein